MVFLADRVNGTSQGTISAQWYNDFKQILTGVMADQAITILPTVSHKALSGPPAAPTVAVAAGGSIDLGAHTYHVTYLDSLGGETTAGTGVTATTTAGNQTVSLTAIPTGPSGVTQRNIYRSKAGTTNPSFLLTTINDNTTTTFTDTVADSTLPATTSPTRGNLGGCIRILNSVGTCNFQVYNNGSLYTDGGTITSDGVGGFNTTRYTALGSFGLYTSPTNYALTLTNTVGGVNESSLIKFQTGGAAGTWWTWMGTIDTNWYHAFGAGSSVLWGFDGTNLRTSAPSGIVSGGLLGFGAGVGGVVSQLTYDSVSLASVYLSPQSGASVTGHYFGTWNGAAEVKPFSVGGQFASSLSWVDNSGHFNDNGKPVPFLVATGASTAGRQIFTGTTTPTGANEGDIWIKA